MEYVSTCIHAECITVWQIGESAGERVGQLEQMSLFTLIVKYWCRTLYCPRQYQMILLQCLNVISFSLLFFFLASPANVFHKYDIKRGAGAESRGLAC